uniref:RNA-directed DNA polymerase n=1 Tax=Tanacetum cinerariifolium TaxID=118510 RepID=A0A6L2N9Z8_TANCI|nr:reverse transcriptase domain-containing protein [Tanacetum cinerariifolium]
MTTLADKAILLGADNRPPMLGKDMYDSWKSRMELYMMNRQHGRMTLESVENERECKLYDEFDKFAYKKGESLRDFYLRFSLLLNDMNIYNMKLEQSQVNTKFLNTLPLEWSKFVTVVKLVRDLHTTNVDQLQAYLGQHEFHTNEVRLMHELFQKGDDPIDAINHMISLLTAVVTSWGDKILWLLVRQDNTHPDQVEIIQGNRGLLFVTTVKEKDTCQSNAQSQKGKEMRHGSMIRCSLSKHQDALNSTDGGNFLDKMPHKCLAIIESKSKVRYSCNKPIVAMVSTNSTSGISPNVVELKDMPSMATFIVTIFKNSFLKPPQLTTTKEIPPIVLRGCQIKFDLMVFLSPVYQPLDFQPPTYQAPAPQTQGVSNEDFSSYVKANDTVMRNMQTQGQNMQNQLTILNELITKFVNSNSASTSSLGTLRSNTIANLRSDLKAITTRSGVSYDGPQILPPPSFLPKVVENKPEAIKDTVHPTNNESTEDIFKDMSFEISFADTLILMPKFPLTLKALIENKEKLSEVARTSLNEHCSAVLLKKLPEKLGDPGKFLIPFDFTKKAECLALADLDASINLMPLSVWNKLPLYDLTPTCMTLELADRSISRSVEVAEDVYVKVGSFHFPADFVVVDFDADHRVPLILGRSFLKTGRALIDVFEGEITLHVGKEAITFNLDQTSRYSANYNDMTEKRIDVIDMACEEYSQEVLGFSDVISSGNPTPYYDPIVSTTSSTLTPFRNSDFLLEEVDAFLAIKDDPTSLEVDQSYLDSEGDILILEAFLNDDPSLPPPNQGNHLPKVCKELKICEAKSDKSLIDEPLEVELKDLPPHLEYAFLEGDNKFPVIIAKDLSVEEKAALITVLKSHKRAIAWKLSDIKGIDPEFCTHKILMEEDFEPAVQHQKRVNPKIHDVIKQEVIKLLDAGLIYPISDSPWVSPVQCVPKKGGFTVVENEDNELIPTRLVTGWRVCIDYRKLNEATRNDHFPLPFMDQILERLAGNQYYFFLDGFSDYFQIPIDPKDQEKTMFTCPYRTFAYYRMPFGLCNAPGTFQRCMMAIFYDMIKKTMEVFIDDFVVFRNSFQSCLSHLERMLKSKTMTEAESNYTTTEKEMLAVVYAFKKFRSYLIMNKSIMYMDHSVLKYLFAKKDSKARLLRWVLLLQIFTFKVIDTKGAENLAADHLSRLENPHQNMLDPKGINKLFPLETLNLVSTRANQSTSWFADFTNYHAGNFVVKGMSS